MRRLTEPQAHRQRIEILEGRYPEGLKARCAKCERVTEANGGRFVVPKGNPFGTVQVFICSDCLEEAASTAA